MGMKWLALVAVLAMAFLPGASALCGGSYATSYNITALNNHANPFYANDTYGINLGDSPQYIACNASSNYLCYASTSDYACYKDDTKMPTFIDQGNGTQYGLPEKDLLLWLHMNSVSGNDSSIYNHQNSNTTGLNTAPGKIGKGVQFGMDEKMNFGDINASDGLTSLTVMACFNLTSTAGVDIAAIVAKSGSGSAGWQLSYCASGTCTAETSIDFYVRAPGDQSCDVQANIELNKFYCVAATYDGETSLIYMNGTGNVTTCAGPSGAIVAGSESVTIGERSTGVHEFPGVIDEVRVYNRTLSGAEINAWFNNTHPDGYSVAVEAEGGYMLSIISPENTTYVGTTSLPLLYSFSNVSACEWSAYSLDGAANVTLECINSTVSFASGYHSVRVWVLDDLGDVRSSTLYFTASYASYTLNITDELTYNTLYNGTIPGIVFNNSVTKLYVYCAESTETTTITSNPMSVSIGCAFEEIKLSMTDANGTHWRTSYPTVFNGTLEFIMVNETATDAIEQTWEMYDVTGDYTNGFLKVTKAIGSYGIKTIEEKLIDASGNAVLYLIPGERYCFSVLNSGMTSERNLGCLYATSETSTRTEISRVPYAPDIDLTYKDVLVYFTWSKDDAYIRGIYNDTLGLTSSVNFTVYNASSITQVMFTSVSTFNYVVFTYNAVNTNGTYIAIITATHGKYGTLIEKKVIGFYATGQEKPALPSGYGWLLSVSGGLICIFMMLAFGRKRQNIGIGVSVLFMLLFMYWGWFDSVPMLGWTFLTLITFIAVIGFFIKRDNA